MAKENAPDSYNMPGEFRLKKLELVNYRGESVDVSELYEIIEIGEDLFNTTLSGSVVLHDATDLQQRFPVIGQEKVRIRFTTVEGKPEISKEFSVFQVSQAPLNEHSVALILYFCSTEMLVNKSTRVSRSWNALSVDTIVRSVMRDSIGTEKALDIEPTQGIHRYIAPNVTPFSVINRMLPRAKSQEFPKSASFVFFETVDGFHFKSIDKLIAEGSNEPLITYTMAYKTRISDDIQSKFYSINDLQIQSQANTLQNLTRGYMGSVIHGFDPVTKTFGSKVNDYDTLYKDAKHLEGETKRKRPYKEEFEFSNSPESLVKFVLNERFREDSQYVQDNSRNSENLPKKHFENFGHRYSQLGQYLNHTRIKIEVPGNSELRCGDVISVDVVSKMAGDRDTNEKDRYLRGKYLIAALKHKIEGAEYVTIMELTKDSFHSSHDEEVETQ